MQQCDVQHLHRCPQALRFPIITAYVNLCTAYVNLLRLVATYSTDWSMTGSLHQESCIKTLTHDVSHSLSHRPNKQVCADTKAAVLHPCDKITTNHVCCYRYNYWSLTCLGSACFVLTLVAGGQPCQQLINQPATSAIRRYSQRVMRGCCECAVALHCIALLRGALHCFALRTGA